LLFQQSTQTDSNDFVIVRHQQAQGFHDSPPLKI
jgi:hypothetical protein